MIDTEEAADPYEFLGDDFAELTDVHHFCDQALTSHLHYLFDRMDTQWLRRQEMRKTQLHTRAKTLVIGFFVLLVAFASIPDRFSTLSSLVISEVPIENDAQDLVHILDSTSAD